MRWVWRGKYVVKVNNRKVLDGVLEAHRRRPMSARSSTVLRAIDKLDKFGTEGVELLLGDGRKDESGDFTKGAGLVSNRSRTLRDYLSQIQQRSMTACADSPLLD